MDDYNKNKVGFFRHRKLKNKNLLTNNFGHFIILNNKEYRDYLSGALSTFSEIFQDLKVKGFINEYIDFKNLIPRYQSKTTFLKYGPSLHIIVITLRCNHKCLYCHASAGTERNNDLDMTIDLARDTVDTIFQTTNHNITIEFQGGEPLLNWNVIKFIVEYARVKSKICNKILQITLVSNFSLMDDEKLKYFLKHRVSLCTSFDGPEKIHNKNRLFLDGNSYKNAVKWLKRIKKAYNKKLSSFKPAALTTITKYTLPYYKELVDEYAAVGLSSIYLRHLNPFGFAKNTWQQIGYSAEEFINFYKKSVDYIIDLNLKKKKKIKESLATTFLTKILTDKDPNHLDYRSPCGAGIGQVAYNYNGDIYTCDEGRMFGRIGDDSFKMGNVRKSSYEELMGSDVVKSMCMASCLDTIPSCSECVYKPYCGVCPVYNYSEQGSIFGQMPTNGRCKINKAIFDYLFEKLQDKKVERIFQAWISK